MAPTDPHTTTTAPAAPSTSRGSTQRLAGKVAFISGAARGIGRAQAIRFADEGADIIGIDLCGPVDSVLTPPATPADLAATADAVRSVGRSMSAHIVDVRDPAGLRDAAARGASDLGGIDIVCATAGITSAAPAVELTETQWSTMLDVNLTGVWNTVRACVPHLIEREGGSIVLVSSIAGLKGLANVAHYSAAKHGVVGLMRTLALELAPHSIRVNTLHPTNVNTAMIQNEFVRSTFVPHSPEPTQEQFADAARAMNVLPVPWVEPEDVANASLFLASDEARFITSVALPVDAGALGR